ncbi:type II toxin-antitoxin system VapC family toxin [Nodosilinea sp. P-1105]|uniref:type II toxin-antitoxin system VapC family toxin n=1 Tax=Nodosilinea sp. P-1105 TaxID=2546229 RepID=UPI001469D68D|nr:type II toxin-antitoxin system VapC family toxin [Nodosilinea sp. P-1105]NMF82624.1 type II toxin-antitoxin system VapC family toxin [Nodosilinea sp. P-1105]
MVQVVVVDTSALIALLLQESEAEQIAGILSMARTIRITAPNLLETAIVAITRRGEKGYDQLQAMLKRLEVEVVACDGALVEIAIQAWQQYGKGRHPAGLNFGDCFSYALAKQQSTPLLFKGEDFSQTDLLSALDLPMPGS